MCGYMLDEKKLSNLEKIGVKDSKLLSPKQRDTMYNVLKSLADDMVILKVSADQIDKMRSITNLNKIEIQKMCELINVLAPDKVIIDAIESNVSGFKRKILAGMENGTEVVAENFADTNHRIVGAASIVAKHTRDHDIKQMHKKFGDFGSGYPSDPVTVKFLKRWLESNREFPDIVRKSWMTAMELKKDKEQMKLDGF